jgi:hypothetical protein
MQLSEAKKIIFEKKPELAKLYDAYKDKTWREYITENYPQSFVLEDRSDELLKVLTDMLYPLLGEDKTLTAINTLRKTGFVSTCDHSGILCHPFFSNIALARKQTLEKNDSIICFTCGAVSLTNSSYPRGVFFHDDTLELIKIPLVSLKGRQRSVYGLASFSKSKIQQILHSVTYLNLKEKSKEKLTSFFNKIKNHHTIFNLERFSDQLTIINDVLWKEIFPDDNNLLYIEVENVVRNLLLDIHLQKNTLIHKILFDQNTRSSYITHFEAIIGAHDTAKQTGSHLFWYIDEKKQKRVQLFVQENNLVSQDKKIIIPLEPEVLRSYMLRFELLPTMALCYSMLSFYYGLTLGGGFSQIKYLGDMKRAWQHIDPQQSIDTKTNIFSGEFVLIGLFQETKTVAATLVDLLLHSRNPQTDTQVALNECTVGDTIDAMMDEFVEIVTGTKPQIENLSIHHTINISNENI